MSGIYVTAEVEVDEDEIKDAGYHHEDDCPVVDLHIEEARHALADWHDTAHGLTLWSGCAAAPCTTLPTEFRS